jgi:glycosyltransferase involved in cell wall biosynthesis
VISIVTISMNQGHFLPTAVNSVLSQQDVDLEYVIVDAGSTDGSREYLASIRDRRVRLILEPDEGPADGLNKGVRSTNSAVVGYLNADDLYLAGALRAVDALFTRRPEIDVIYGDGWIIDDKEQVIRHIESTPWSLRQYLYGGVTVLQQSTFFRRDAFDRTAGFNLANTTSWDGELVVDLALAGCQIHHERADWSAFRLHAGGISGSGRLEDRYRQDLRRLKKRVTGLGPGAVDTLLGATFRCVKLVRSPGYAIRRAGSRHQDAARLMSGPDGFEVAVGSRQR